MPSGAAQGQDADVQNAVLIMRMDSISRDEFMHRLQERGIGVSLHYKPLHLMSYYRVKYDLKQGDFPNALRRYRTAISLPIYPDLTDEEVARVIESVIDLGIKYRSSSG